MSRLHRAARFIIASLVASAISAFMWAQDAAAGCSGAEAELTALTRDLNRDAFEDAMGLLAKLQSSHAKCPAVLLANARILSVEGPPSAAARAFSEYADAMPDEAVGMAYFARFLIEQQQYAQADEFSSVALGRAPESAVTQSVRGQILAITGHDTQAKELLEKSCALDPDNVETQFQLGVLFDRVMWSAEAAKHFQKVVELDPAYASAWDYLALNLEPLGKEDQADAAYRQGLSVNREGRTFDAFLDYNYGRFLAKRNQLADAKKHLDKAVRIVPDFRATWYDRAKIGLRMGDYAQARSDGERALSITDKTGGILDLQVYTVLEHVYRRLGLNQLADQYAGLVRNTLPPARKDFGTSPQP